MPKEQKPLALKRTIEFYTEYLKRQIPSMSNGTIKAVYQAWLHSLEEIEQICQDRNRY